ncbi:MAG: hypothetical protein ACI9JN_002754 [Bacteroidia bacterium]|jgi:hypothetical protein
MMYYDNSIQSRILAAEFLIAQGTQKKVISQYCNGIGNLYDSLCAQMPPVEQKHRYGTHWLRGESCLSATRAVRLIKSLFGTTHIDHALIASEFVSLCECYAMKFPNDDSISPNRMHYLIQSIRSGEVLVHDSCKCCKKPYVTHRDDAHTAKCTNCTVSSDETGLLQ